MADINRQYEREHLQNLQKDQREVEQAYLSTIDQIFAVVAITTFTKEIFKLSNYPALKREIERVLREHGERIYRIMQRGIIREWGLSETKNTAVLKETYGEIAQPVLDKLKTDPKLLQDFVERPKNRIRLSARVWKLTNQLQAELEGTLFAGIQEGRPAVKMAAEMKGYLKEPDRLFRRVRNAQGSLVLSENAKRYKPGAGIYKSSYRNALRLTAHQTNASYRTADHIRWKQTPFILGVEVKLSASHPRRDICDMLVGIFPSSYKHTGFHIQCICYSIPILPSIEEFREYEQAVLNGTDADFTFKNKVKDVHPKMKQWIIDNAEKLEGQKSAPLFLQDNPKLLTTVLSE